MSFFKPAISPRQLAALCLAGVVAGAQAQEPAPEHQSFYAVGALGSTRYGYDCFFFVCNENNTSAGRVALGYRFSRWSVEAGFIRSGRVSIESTFDPRPGETLRLQSASITAGTYWHWGSAVQGLVRFGLAEVRHERTGEDTRSVSSPTVGLGLLVKLRPALAAELAWDYTHSEGRNWGTTSASTYTLGLRVHF